MSSSSLAAYPFQEPTPAALLLLAAYLVLLNLSELVAQRALAAGLLGPVFVGAVFGAPLADWLPGEWMATFEVVGYLGLMLLVFEGGLTTHIPTLVPLLRLAALVATTGLLAPIGLSLALLAPPRSFAFPPAHAFAAGAALASTSLGTSLAVLRSSGVGGALTRDVRASGVGTLLLAAAVMDDVVAFVLARVITVLGGGGAETGGGAVGPEIGRIVGVTVGLGIVLALVARYLVRPFLRAAPRWLDKHPRIRRLTIARSRAVALAAVVLVFMGIVAAAGYAGTSVLYGAFVAGLILADVDDCVKHTQQGGQQIGAVEMWACLAAPSSASTLMPGPHAGSDSAALRRARSLPSTSAFKLSPLSSSRTRLTDSPGSSFPPAAPSTPDAPPPPSRPCSDAFASLVGPLLAHVLLPLFFGAIGAAIPFRALWTGGVVWRGVVYALLMAVGKVVVGGWVLGFARPGAKVGAAQQPATGADEGKGQGLNKEAEEQQVDARRRAGGDSNHSRRGWRRTLAERVPPAALLGLAMVARGEIGLLISQIARNAPDSQLSEREFLITTWAIVLCTIVGPVGVGIVVRRLGDRVMGAGWG